MVMDMATIDRMVSDASSEQAQISQAIDEQDAKLSVEGVEVNVQGRNITIYHRETGEPRIMPKLAAAVALRKKYRMPGNQLHDQYIFSLEPTREFHRGASKCLLHPDGDERTLYDSWGLPVCTSAHIASPGEVQRHMKMRHPSAMSIIKEHQDNQTKEIDRQGQSALAEAMLEAINRMSGTPAVPAEPAPVLDTLSETTSEQLEVPEVSVVTTTCPKCKVVLTAETDRKLIAVRAGHTRSKHPKWPKAR